MAFCPFDSSITLNSATAAVVFSNPSFPQLFVQGQDLSFFLQYGFSNTAGYLAAFSQQTGSPPSPNTCTLSTSSVIRPNSVGRQRLSLLLSFSQLNLGSLYNNYPSFKVIVTLPAVGGNLAVLTTSCPVDSAILTCAVAWSSPTATLTFTYTGTGSVTISSLSFNLYLTSSSPFSGTGNIQASIVLPQEVSGVFQLFGSSYGATNVVFGSCNTALSTAPNSYLAVYALGSLNLISASTGSTSSMELTFKADSPRDYFYLDSFVEINLGFLATSNQPLVANGFRCSVNQLVGSTYNASTLFSRIDYTSLAALKLYPKYEFANPSTTTFKLSCVGSIVGSGVTTLSGKWTDAGSLIYQQSVALSAPTLLTASGSVTISSLTKQYNNQGSETFTTLELAVGSALDITARFYIQFAGPVPPRLNSEGYAECYIRASTSSTTYTQSFCSFLSDQLLVVYNTLPLAAAGTVVIDIMGVAVGASLTTSHKVYLTVDADALLSNGVLGVANIAELAPGAVPASTLTISGVTASTPYTRTLLTLSVSFSAPAGLFSSNNKLALLLPSPFAVWNTKGTALTCTLASTAAPGTNLATACLFLSKRLVELTLSSSAATTFVMTVAGIYSPV